MRELICLSIGTVMLFATSCSGAPQQKMGGAVPYKTMKIELSNKTLQSSYTASIRGKQHVEIRPQVGGVITKICINEGANVRKDETLFIIDQVPYKAALETAKANVSSAQAKYNNANLVAESQKELFDAGVVADFDLQKAQNSALEAKAALSQAQAQLLNAQNNLSYTEVKSPVDGVASMIPYHVGALVSSSISEPLVTVSHDKEMYAYFSMNESQILQIMRASGTLEKARSEMPEVQLRLSDGSDYSENGKIDAISGTVDNETGAVSLRAIFNNPNHILRNGGSGKVLLSTVRNNCVVIPKSATYELQNKVFVFKVVDGKAQSEAVTVFGVNDGKEYVVESGLEPGDVIIAEGAGLVREGAAVAQQNAAKDDQQAAEKSEK